MDIDWEVEIGGDAPVLEAHWPGLIDLRNFPERVDEIQELTLLPLLKEFLLVLNSEKSPVWTSKCDAWRPAPGTIACYIDLLPREAQLFADWRALEAFCRELAQRIEPNSLRLRSGNSEACHGLVVSDAATEVRTINLVIRSALIDCQQGFGITSYFSAVGSDSADSESVMRTAMATFSNLFLGEDFLGDRSKLK